MPEQRASTKIYWFLLKKSVYSGANDDAREAFILIALVHIRYLTEVNLAEVVVLFVKKYSRRMVLF